MRVLITGASGNLGRALIPVLIAKGYECIRMVRGVPRSAGERQWHAGGEPQPQTFSGADAVIHLAGESIAGGRWTPRRKTAIRDSRVLGTRTVVKSIQMAAQPPSVLISASAIGYYGDRGEEILTERSPSGSGFLAEVCRQWEAECQPAREIGVRVVQFRSGLILMPDGGALQKMLLPFRLGLGGRLGSGSQWWSWISIEDIVGLIAFALTEDRVQGPLNAVSPDPLTNAEFTRTLAQVLRRPAVFPAPEFALRLGLGEMAEELLLASQRVQPMAALAAGYRFRQPRLQPALESLLNRRS